MVRIYHVTNTRGTRAIWLCEELGMEYEVVKVDFGAAYRATPEWRALNPVGKVPVLADGELTMFESGAMLDHILARYGEGRLQPAPGSDDFARFRQWCWFAEATFSRPLGEIVNHRREFPADQEMPAVVSEMQDRAALCLQAVLDHMQGRSYLVGETFTAADIMMGYTLMLCDMLIADRVPAAQDNPYWQRLQVRPAYQAAIAY